MERRCELFQNCFRVEAADLHLYQTAPGDEVPCAGAIGRPIPHDHTPRPKTVALRNLWPLLQC